MNVELAAEIRFRCPHCQKLFCTDMSAFDGQSAAGFDCSSCLKEFALFREKNQSGLYRTSETQSQKMAQVSCPKCKKLKFEKIEECPHCGVLETQFKELQKIENPRLYELNKLWQVVVENMTSDDHHQRFLDLAQKQMALNFAAQKYNDLKAILGEDQLIQKYLKQIEMRLEMQVRSKISQAQTHSQQKNSLTTSGKIFILVGLAGVFVLIFNKINPIFPNLNGLVVAITVLSFALSMTSGTTQTKN